MGTGIGLFLPWENEVESLGLGFAHWELGKRTEIVMGESLIVFNL